MGKGQGNLEYVLMIMAAIGIAMIVLIILVGFNPIEEEPVEQWIGVWECIEWEQQLSVNEDCEFFVNPEYPAGLLYDNNVCEFLKHGSFSSEDGTGIFLDNDGNLVSLFWCCIPKYEDSDNCVERVWVERLKVSE